MASVKQFAELLYRRIVPKRPQEAAPLPLAKPTPTRPALSLLHATADRGKYMTNQFNLACAEVGIQCSVQLDPSDWYKKYYMKNVGQKLLMIEYATERLYLEPGEQTVIKMRSNLDSEWNQIPRITVLNNGWKHAD